MERSILDIPVAALLECYRNKSLSPVEVSKAALRQAEAINPSLNAFALIADEKSVLLQARQSEERWRKGRPLPLDGVPATSKDGADVAGWPTRDGSLMMPDAPAETDAPPEARLREAGAIFIGKTTMPEFGHKGVTDSPVYGITRNPWNPAKTCGGSSGGAAVAAATGAGFLHTGTDGGGSIRIPASFCGVYGFKPSGGVVPRHPPNPFTSLVATGPIARRAEDAALMMDVITLPDARDGNALPYRKHDFAANLARPLPKNLRIGYAPTLNGAPVAPEVAALVAAAAEKLESAGAVEEITLDIPELVKTFNTHWMGVAAWLLGQFPESRHAEMDPYFLSWAERGKNLSLPAYITAQVERLKIIDRLQALFGEYDILVLPTMAMPAFDIGKNVPDGADGKPWEDWTPFTFPANLAKLPAASLPCGLTSAGLPVGVQVVSGFLKDDLVLNVSHALEALIGFEGWLARNGAEDGRMRAAG